MNISIIGLGTVGIETFKQIVKSKKHKQCIGIDINLKLIQSLKNKYNVRTQILKSDVYIINVYSSKQIINVIKNIIKINHKNKPLIIIESTIDPKYINDILTLANASKDCNLVLCPHRLNPNDKKHQVFNLNRVIAGATKECLNKGIKFYSEFMNKKLLTKTDINHAIFSKITENAYRFVEISIAEELCLLCKNNKKLNLNFKELRKCTNSKWNIDIKDAINGIGGKCLPKDVNILNNYFKSNSFFSTAIKIDKKYKKTINKNMR
jgi:nucleotide sugar dehydrogenase